MKKTVLIIEDEKDFATVYGNILKKEDFNVLMAADGTTGKELALKEQPDLILLDILLPGVDGITLLRELRARGLKSEVIILTASPILHVQEGVRLGIYAYLNKALSTPKEIVALIREALKRKEAAK